MPITIAYSHQGHIVIMELIDPWTMTDLAECFPIVGEFRDSKPFIVHNLMDMTRTKVAPPGMMRAREAPLFSHPRGGYMVIIGGTSLLLAVTEAIGALKHFDRLKTFSTRAEGFAFLESKIAQEPPTP